MALISLILRVFAIVAIVGACGVHTFNLTFEGDNHLTAMFLAVSLSLCLLWLFGVPIAQSYSLERDEERSATDELIMLEQERLRRRRQSRR